MLRIALLGVLLGIGSFFCNAQEMEVEGVYRGKNLFVQNPYNVSNKKFCLEAIYVNDALVVENPVTTAVQIDLSNFEVNAPVKVRILHKRSCIPNILNLYALQAGEGFAYVQTMVDNATLSWVTTGEMPGGRFLIEKEKIDRWDTVTVVAGKGNLDNNQYSFGVQHYSGENNFKITYTNKSETMVSEPFSFYSPLDPIQYFPVQEVEEWVSLSRPTDYQVLTMEGKLLKHGVGMEIFVGDLEYGEYQLIIENREELFYRPEPEIDPEHLEKLRKRNKKRKQKEQEQ